MNPYYEPSLWACGAQTPRNQCSTAPHAHTVFTQHPALLSQPVGCQRICWWEMRLRGEVAGPGVEGAALSLCPVGCGLLLALCAQALIRCLALLGGALLEQAGLLIAQGSGARGVG